MHPRNPLFLCGFHHEYEYLRKSLPQAMHKYLHICGPSPRNVFFKLPRILAQKHEPQHIYSVGCAGAINKNLKIFDWVDPHVITLVQLSSPSISFRIREGEGTMLATTPIPICGIGNQIWLKTCAPRATSVDMETAAIIHGLKEHPRHHYAGTLRIITDHSLEETPALLKKNLPQAMKILSHRIIQIIGEPAKYTKPC